MIIKNIRIFKYRLCCCIQLYLNQCNGHAFSLVASRNKKETQFGCNFNMCNFFSLLRLIPKFLWRCLKTWNDNYNWSPWMRWHGTCLIPRVLGLEYVFTFIACRNCKGYKMGISNFRDPCLSRYDKDSLNSKAVSFKHTSMSKYVVLHVVTYPCMYMSERFSSGTLSKLN